jgi:hypothetical protein
MDWQPIKTAPKDREIMLWPHCWPASWDMGADNWLVFNIPLDAERRVDVGSENPVMWCCEFMADDVGVKPTHWAEMPEGPPAAEEG